MSVTVTSDDYRTDPTAKSMVDEVARPLAIDLDLFASVEFLPDCWIVTSYVWDPDRRAVRHVGSDPVTVRVVHPRRF